MRDTYQKVLVRACLIVGDETDLANQLGVSVSLVVDWLLGDRRIPTDAFLLAADIVLIAANRQAENNRNLIEANRLLLKQIRKRYRSMPPAKG